MVTKHLSFHTAQPSGSFALHAGRAMALQPLRDAVLRITQGSAWITLPSQPGDHFLRSGDSLHVRAKDRVVMEAWPLPGKSSATSPSLYFDWDPVPMRQAAHTHVAVRGTWAGQAARQPAPSAAVAQALVDLRAALGLGAGAVARLTTVLVAFCARSTLASGRFTPAD
jgi:hypothetical protein